MQNKNSVTHKSIAVLPFANMSASRENEFFSDGITEEIINALTRIPGLRVTSRTSSFFFKNKNIPISDIGKQLNVSIILEGSVRLAGDMMRITAQLIDAKEDFHFWSETWDRKIDDIFGVQDELSLLIANRSREFVGHFDIQDHLVATQTNNFNAYELYLKGKYHFRKWNPQDAKISADCYKKALEIDKNHVESLLGLADALSFLGTTGFMDQVEAWDQTEELINKALTINGKSPEGHYLLSNLYFFKYGNYEKSLNASLLSYELNPNYAEANRHLSFLYTIAGKHNEARIYLDNALAIDPLSQETAFFDAYFYYMTGSYEIGFDSLNKILTENGNNIPAHTIKCYCLLKMGRLDETINYFDDLPGEIVVEEDKLGIEALCFALKGDETKAKRCLRNLEKLAENPEGFRANSFLFFLYAILNDKNKAFAWVEKEMKGKFSFLLIHYTDPLADNLKGDPRYNVFKEKIYVLAEEVSIPKPKRQPISAAEADKLIEKLNLHLSTEKSYLNPNLSLKSLANEIGLHANQLSWLINEKAGLNFNQLINNQRVGVFKELAQDPANAHLSLLGLAFESGFSSKTVFNTYFKKEVGLTPKEWIKLNIG